MQIVITRRSFLFLAVLFLIIMAGGLAYIYLPRAYIEVRPKLTSRTVSQEIILSSSASEPDFVRFILPAQMVHREAQEHKTFERGDGTQFDEFATGKIVLFNKQTSEQRLLPKTNLRHEESGVFFLTDTAVTVPPQGEARVTVTAKEEGAAGNVPAGRFIVDKLPVSLQQYVYGESGHDFDGGVAVNTPLSEKELAEAGETARKLARDRLAGEMTAEAGGARVRSDFISYSDEEVEASAAAGSRASQFTVTAKLTARAFLVDENDLLSLTLLTLRQSAFGEEEFVAYEPHSFSVEIERGDFERGEAVVLGSLTGSFASKIGPRVFGGGDLAGLTENEVREVLQQLAGVGEVSVKFWPFWVNTVPARRGAVEIVVTSN